MKKIGCCTLCEKEVFNIQQRFTEPPLERWPRFVGAPTDDAMRLEFELLDGSTANMTFCRECAKTAPKQLKKIWAACLEAARFENDNRTALGALDDEAARERGAIEIKRQAKMSIVKMIHAKSWADEWERA